MQSGSLPVSRSNARQAKQGLHFFIALPLFAALHLFAADMPTAEEMAEMQKLMESAQEQMKNLDPQTKAALEALVKQSASTGDGLGLPPRSPKLANVKSAPLSPTALKAYVDNVANKMDRALSPEALKRARVVETELKKRSDQEDALRAAANGLAAMGAWPEATFIMARLARNSGQTQDVSNLSAFLTLMHAAPAALPLLHTLDARYPQNSTVLNNLGQAYFQLGDIDRAEHFLVAAVQRSPRHPQANLTRALIQQSRGELGAAQESLEHALEGGYSKTKRQQLEKSGKKWRPKSAWRGPMPQDPLGLEKITLPPFPVSAAELPAAVAAWDNFQTLLRERLEALEVAEKRTVQQIESMSQSQQMNVGIRMIAGMPFMEQALQAMSADAEHFRIVTKRETATRTALLQKHADARQELSKELKALSDALERKYGNDTVAYDKHICDGVPDAYTRYLKKVQNELEGEERAHLASLRRHLNEEAYLSQFVQPTAPLREQAKLTAQRGYTGALQNVQVALAGISVGSVPQCLNQPVKKGKRGKLPDYNDLNCEYVSKLDFPGMGSMRFACNKTEVEFAPVMAPFEVAWSSKYTGKGDEELLTRASAAIAVDGVKVGGFSEFDEGGFKKGGVSVGVSTSVGPKVGAGPLEIGNSVGVTGTLEFDRNGVSDVGIEAGLKSKVSSTPVSTDQGGQVKSELEAGLKSGWSWSSGVSGSSSGGFDSSVFDL